MAIPNLEQDGKVLQGQLVNTEFRVAIPYTEEVINFDYGGASSGVGVAGVELTPMDANATLKKIFDYTTLDAAKLAIFVQNPGVTSFRIPKELLSLTAVFSTSKGTGSGSSTPHATSSGTSWSVGVSSSNKGSASVDMIPDLQPDFKAQPQTDSVPSIECYFFTSASQTIAQVLTRLSTELGATVLAWPILKPKEHTITLKGQSVSLSAGANLQLSGSQNSANTSESDNESFDIQVETRSTVRSLDLPECLHGSLTILGTGGTPWTATDSITVTVGTTITATGSMTGTVTSGGTTGAYSATGLITPHTFSATSPAAIPTSGLYLQEIRPQASEGDLFLQLAIVVNFAYFA